REIEMVSGNVPIKKGRRYGIGRTSEAISTSSSQHSVSSSSILQYIDRMKTELDEERTKRRAIEEELHRVTVFISNLCPEQFSATQTQPDSATQSPDDRCF
ncbi:BnaCnng68460D, partial [Brassica napus]